jgi:FkbM family methyltransferase
MVEITRALGMARSLLMYYGIPGRRGRMRQFYAQFIRPGDLCFDIGAHVGNRMRVFLDLGARVVALEPQPAFADLLRRWYGHRPDVTVIEAALGAAIGEAEMRVSDLHPTVTTLSAAWAERVSREDSFAGVKWERRGRVRVTTLDALIEAHGLPAFCKIDVEGYELEVLRGLSQPIRALSFEALPAAREVALGCVDRLAELGQYEYNWSVGESQRLVWGEWVEAGRLVDLLATFRPSGDVFARHI